MTRWNPNFEGDPQVRAIVGKIVSVSAGANNDGRRPSADGRDATGRFPWAAWVSHYTPNLAGHADTLDDAKGAAVAAAIQILTDALAEATAAASDDNHRTAR